MEDHFLAAFEHVIGVEREFSDDPADSGGKTRFGITEAVARENGYDGEMQELSFDLARDIYRKRYWDSLHLDIIASLSFETAREMFDIGVNIGIYRAATFLQRSLSVLNRNGRDYPDLKVDGDIGNKTILSLRTFLIFRGKDGETVLLRMLNSLQGNYYVELAEAREKDEKFVFGWFLNRVANV